ncbi:hypothetical protein OF122_11295 [Pelagibacterium flavum]|uniref:HTH merR-type domain-containing protein n=1 Tax=Pelagibacterium flavum TaxID=2984530 RepID=A0ABY6IMH2_9HYPH|nr:hypothetical protein [Pelagibacterium sp. YIM 151497]UYQ70659.1 hypothetical protein OF122_11295 [Pelagibacterium sp. YIM 151497]
MTLPQYWRRASFTVPEIAKLIGTVDATLRSYMVRTPVDDFMGAKTGGRIYLSVQDAFYYFLVSELSAYGVPSRAAMYAAADIANQCDDHLPREELLVVRISGGASKFHLTNERPTDDKPALVLPIRALAEVLIEDAKAIYASEAA